MEFLARFRARARARGIFLRKSLSKVAAAAASLDTNWPISVMLRMDSISFRVLQILRLRRDRARVRGLGIKPGLIRSFPAHTA